MTEALIAIVCIYLGVGLTVFIITGVGFADDGIGKPIAIAIGWPLVALLICLFVLCDAAERNCK